MNRLIFLGKPGDGFGWGICNANLLAALKELCHVELCEDESRNRFDAPVFCPVIDPGLRPPRPVKCPRLIGYGFWELPLDSEAARVNAGRYYHIFAGSSWCAARVKSASYHGSVSALVQGVDFTRFTPQPWPERNGFRVFSGGKYEFRKGQDIVLAAMRIFMSQRTDAVLIASWHNPWPATMLSMNESPLIDPAECFRGRGLPPERVFVIPPTPNEKMPGIYAQSDIGLFPNRAEGGTNLVMMEYMACSRPVIASAHTGHADIFKGDGITEYSGQLTQGSGQLTQGSGQLTQGSGQLTQGSGQLTQGSFDEAGWFHADVSDCLVHLEKAYQNKTNLPHWGVTARQIIEPWTWNRAAEQICRVAFGSSESSQTNSAQDLSPA